MVRNVKQQGLIIIENNFCNIDNIIKSHIISLIKQNSSAPIWEEKIINNKYFDMVEIDGNNETIKKEQILNLINQFSTNAIESLGMKFYIIKKFENCTPEAVNCILKFLEEPNNNIYAIFTTKNINMINPTIKSRCHCIFAKANNAELTNLFKKYNLSNEEITLFKKISIDISEYIKLLDENKFNLLIKNAELLINNINNPIIVKQISEIFKKFNYSEINLFLNILLAKKNNIELINIKNINNPSKILIFNRIWSILKNE